MATDAQARAPRRRTVRFQDASEVTADEASADSLLGASADAAGAAAKRLSASSYMASFSVGGEEGDAPPFIVKGFKPAFKLKARRTGRRSKASAASAEEAPAMSPDYVKAQFVWAHKSDNMALMEEALNAFAADPPGGPLHKKMPQDMLDETLMYAMLSNNLRMTRLLINRAGATALGADAAHDRHKGDLSGCECGSHPGILLVTLARQGSLRMVELALEGGVDPDATVCDGEARSLWWGEGVSIQGLQLIRSPVLRATFAKSSALTAAAVNNDLRMVKTLLRYGASMDANGWAVVAEAAWVHDPHHQLLSFLLGTLADTLNVYCDACSVALRAAAARGDEETVRWIIDRVDETEDWTSAAGAASAGIAVSGRAARRRKRRTLQLAQQQVDTLERDRRRPVSHEPRRSLSSELSSAEAALSARPLSASSAESGASCLNRESMRQFRGRRQSLVTKTGAALRPYSSDLGAAAPGSPLSSPRSSSHASTGSRSTESDEHPAAAPARRGSKPLALARRMTHSLQSHKSQAAAPVGGSADDLVSFTVAKAVDGLIAEALEPGYVHRDSFARGLEALAQIEQSRVGAPVSLRARSFDLYRIFIDTLAQGLPGSTQDSALTLLHCGVEGFLDLGLTQRANGRTPVGAKAARALAKHEQRQQAAAAANAARPLAAPQRGAWDKMMCGLKSVAALPARPLSSALRRAHTGGAAASSRAAGDGAAAAASGSAWTRRASLDEQIKALSVAVEGGHALIVRHLLGAARRDMHVVVPRLLAAAARANHPELLPVLLEFFPGSEQVRAMGRAERRSFGLAGPARRADAEADMNPAAPGGGGGGEGTAEAAAEEYEEALEEALNNALLVALESHAEEFAAALMDSGARPTRALLVSAITHACQDAEYPDSAADFLLRLRASANVSLSVSDAQDIVDAVVAAEQPNLYVFASVMDIDLAYRKAVAPQHLAALARAASGAPHSADWSDLLLMLLRCLEDSPELEDAVQEAYSAAVNANPTHPGVLHLLMDRAMQSSESDEAERWV